MKKSVFWITSFFVGAIILAGSCEKKDTYTVYQAKGHVITQLGQCAGESILIEVDDPVGIGLPGAVEAPGIKDSLIMYENGIRVPYFSKTNVVIPDKFINLYIDDGTWLHFEYRELFEGEDGLFLPEPPPICPTNIIPPSGNKYIITRIIDIN